MVNDRFMAGEAGDWVLLQQGEMQTFLRIKEKNEENLFLEEISFPSSIKLSNDLITKWIEAGSKGHLSWLIYKVNGNTGTIENCFSKTRNCFIQPTEEENFIKILFSLSFRQLGENERMKVGRLPKPDEPDRRRLWQPPLIVNGKPQENVSFEAWESIWPKDGSDLSGRKIELYFPKKRNDAPLFFPYWIQISGSIGAVRLRVIDSGKNLPKLS